MVDNSLGMASGSHSSGALEDWPLPTRIRVAIPLAALLLLGLGVGFAPTAYAHGGAFGPPPAPRSKGPRGPGGGGGPPSHVDPGFGGPIVTPGGGPPTAPGRASKRKTPLAPTFETSWQLWWSLNREAWLPGRVGGGAATVTPRAAGAMRTAAGWEAERRASARTRAVPFLLGLVRAGTQGSGGASASKQLPDDVVASACIALGKLAHDADAVDALLQVLLDERRAGLVRESAALALGLLRRDDPGLRLPTRCMEDVRARLLQVFDAHVGGHKIKVRIRTRCFAMYAIGLLGDQPFHDSSLSKDGRLISKLLWERLAVPYGDRELHIALLAALGRQPRAGIPDGVQDGLRAIVAKKKALGHRWDLLKRAHAVTTVARLGGVGGHALLLRLSSDKRQPVVVRLASAISIADHAAELAPVERAAALRVVRRSFQLEQQLLGVGLANIAFGRMVGADLGAGSDRALTYDKADQLLLERAEKAPWYLRGWAALGLALAARGGAAEDPSKASDAVRRFRARAQALLLSMARGNRGKPDTRGAAVVGLGLMRARAAAPLLRSLASQAALPADLRAHAALALGQVGGGPGAVEALSDLVVEKTTPDVLRGHAALALSILGETTIATTLTAQLRSEGSTRRLAGAALALGRLGHLAAAGALLEAAADADARPLVRAMALVSLGRLLDPAKRPSLLRLTQGACYPARSRALQEAFTIL